MPNLTHAFAFLLDLARRYPLAALGALLLALLWVTIHARPRLDSGYERRFPEVWARRRREYRQTHSHRCRACLVWNLLGMIPLLGRAVRTITSRVTQLHHAKYPRTPGEEPDRFLVYLCADLWPDHHGDADKWRRAVESIPVVGQLLLVPAKYAFLLTAWTCQLAILGGVGAAVWFGGRPLVQVIAAHVVIR